MSNRISIETTDHKATCLVFLELARQDLENAKAARERYVQLAHKYGLSNVEIGSALELTEARVRGILAGV